MPKTDTPTKAEPTPTLIIADEPFVKLGKSAAPNPFTETVKALKEKMEAGQTDVGASVPVASEDPKDKDTARYNRQLNDAGKDLKCTVRRGIVPDGKGGFKLAFKVTPRITRKPASTSTTP